MKSFQFLLRWVRSIAIDPPFLQRRIGLYNGVAVRDVGFFELSDVQAEYEDDIVEGLIEHAQTGETVTIVGGGLGVSSVVAARIVGSGGQVHVFEGSKSRAETVHETVSLNDVGNTVHVNHGIVGENIDVKGQTSGAAAISPSDIPECAVVELDCEGAEISVLENMTIRPRIIIVETHSHLGAPENDVSAILRSIGYKVISKGDYEWNGSIVSLIAKRQA